MRELELSPRTHTAIELDKPCVLLSSYERCEDLDAQDRAAPEPDELVRILRFGRRGLTPLLRTEEMVKTSRRRKVSPGVGPRDHLWHLID